MGASCFGSSAMRQRRYEEVSTPNETGFDTSKSNPRVERVETLLRGGFDTGFDTYLGAFVENEFRRQTTPVLTP